MSEENTAGDRYAGDEAWQDWFDICSVGGCPKSPSSSRLPRATPPHFSTSTVVRVSTDGGIEVLRQGVVAI